MVFSSFIFVFYFLPLVLALYWVVPTAARNPLLTIASYIFYGWWNPVFCLLMLFSTAVDYFCGLWLSRAGGREAAKSQRAHAAGRKLAVAVSVTVNLVLLGYFKYAAFIADNLNRAAAFLGLEAMLPAIAIALPVGISFYTFQSMSYCIDLYRDDAKPARSFADFACFVSLFPQLVAGPIVRYRELADQLVERTHSAEKFAAGAMRFMIGFSKKILIANPCGQTADAIFSATMLDARCAWLGVLAYAFQIYFDFSGYSDMAIGLGAMFGFQLPENFRSPYRATSVTDFWRRWHITLSTFLRDYLYIPLGGNRHGAARTFLNLFLVMFIGGLWHGAQWTFILWGCLHGAALVFERFLRWRGSTRAAGPSLTILPTFLFVLLAWVLFRAENLEVAARVYAAMFGLGKGGPHVELLWADVSRPWSLAILAVAAALVWFAPRAAEIVNRPLHWPRAILAFGVFIFAIAMMLSQGDNPFLYFQF